VIDFELYQRIHQLHREGLSQRQIACQLRLRAETVAKWLATPRYTARKAARRPSRLDPYRAEIMRLLHEHPYSAQQIFQRLKQQVRIPAVFGH
jgi:transposase